MSGGVTYHLISQEIVRKTSFLMIQTDSNLIPSWLKIVFSINVIPLGKRQDLASIVSMTESMHKLFNAWRRTDGR